MVLASLSVRLESCLSVLRIHSCFFNFGAYEELNLDLGG